MKKPSYFTCLLLVILEISFGQIENKPLSIYEAIKAVRQANPDGMSHLEQMRKSDEYKKLESCSPAVWLIAMQNLDSVAPTSEDKHILFQSFEGLSPENYLDFLNGALDLFSKNQIDLDVFTHSVFYSGGKMQFFISHNYDHPEVAAFLEKAEEVLKKKGEPFMFNVQEARSGKLKKLHDAARANHPELAKQPIPLLRPVVPPPPTAASTAIKPPPMATSDHPTKSVTSCSPSVQVEPLKSTHWLWVIGVIFFVAVAGGVLFKFLRK
jgi:hypothetical protein